MKSHSTFYLRPAIIDLSWSFLLPVGQAQAAVSVTLENRAGMSPVSN